VAPVDDEEDRGAHGSFDHRATDCAPALWVSMHRNWICGGALALAAITLLGWFGKRR
jgi:hypothetical protein